MGSSKNTERSVDIELDDAGGLGCRYASDKSVLPGKWYRVSGRATSWVQAWRSNANMICMVRELVTLLLSHSSVRPIPLLSAAKSIRPTDGAPFHPNQHTAAAAAEERATEVSAWS